MSGIETVCLAASFLSFVMVLVLSRRIAEDVNERLGTDYRGVFVWRGNPWNEHDRLLPGCHKRAALAVALIASCGLLMVAAAVQ